MTVTLFARGPSTLRCLCWLLPFVSESSHYKADGEHTTATLALYCLSLICHLHSSCVSSSYLMGTIPFLAIFCCDRQEREARDLRTFNEAFPSSDQGCLDDTILSVIDGA